MKILFTGSFPPHPGGSGVANGQLLEGLLKKGCQLQIVTPSMPEALGRSQVMRERFSGVKLIEILMDKPQIEPWSDGFGSDEAKWRIATTHRLCENCLKDDPPDLMFVGREAALWGLPELAAKYRLPIAVMCHGISYLLMSHGPQKIVRSVLAELGKVDLAIAPANHIAKSLIEKGLKNGCSIPNGVDTALFRPGPANAALRRDLNLRDDQIVITHASNLKSVKRADDIVASAATCLRANPDLVYVIIGDGPCLKDLRDACRRDGIEDHFRFTGWVDRGQMPDLLRLADIAVMPSAAEGLAMAYLEAMATGLVLIASDIASAREVVTEGETGFLFPVGDTDALSRAILRLAADPALRRQVGARARRHIKTHHQLENSVGQLADAFIALTKSGVRDPRGKTPKTRPAHRPSRVSINQP